MTVELTVLDIVGARLDGCGIPYMLTGSFAMAYYATPRMTRDLDIVVNVEETDIDRLVSAFSVDFYVDADDARTAVRSERLFNLMHFDTGMKVDFIVRKSSEYRRVEFDRRRRVLFGTTNLWIVSCEDLILSKLVWAQETGSELQRRDVLSLLALTADISYIRHWAPSLGVSELLAELTA